VTESISDNFCPSRNLFPRNVVCIEFGQLSSRALSKTENCG